VNENVWMPKVKHMKARRRNRKRYEIDDTTFFTWKSELQKELPSFWQSMASQS
jgi:hypothetical protein